MQLYEYQTEPMLEKLQGGEIDVGVLALPVDLEGLEARELYVEPFIVAMPDHHKLAKRETVRTEDLQGETLLLLEDGHCLRDQALEVCSRVGVQEKQDFRATSLETLRQMVATGAGLTLLPELASRGAYGNAKGVTIRPFAKPAPVRHIGAIWRKTTARGPAIDADLQTNRGPRQVSRSRRRPAPRIAPRRLARRPRQRYPTDNNQRADDLNPPPGARPTPAMPTQPRRVFVPAIPMS